MKNKNKAGLAIIIAITCSILILWIKHGEMLKATYAVVKTETYISYYLPKLATAELEVQQYKDILHQMDEQKAKLNGLRSDIAYNDHYLSEDELDGQIVFALTNQK